MQVSEKVRDWLSAIAMGAALQAVILMVAPAAARAQRISSSGRSQPGAILEISSGPAQEVRAVRAVYDPANGAHWLLVRDDEHPAGPGRWIRTDAEEPDAQSFGTSPRETADAAMPNGISGTEGVRQNVAEKADAEQGDAKQDVEEQEAHVKPPAPILIRGGDPIVVEQSTPVLTARLEAVALEPATRGSLLRARLKATNARVWVIALGPGEAALAPPGVVGQ